MTHVFDADSARTRPAGELLQLEIAGVQVNFHWAPAGTFKMGSPESEKPKHETKGWKTDYRCSEYLHEVTLTRGFWIAETPTTQELWRAVMGSNPSCFNCEGSNDLPVENVNWYECRDFVEKLNRLCRDAAPCGYRYAMPTEAQWEYACRAGTTTAFNFGDSFNGDMVNCWVMRSDGTDREGREPMKTTPVKSYAPNAWGLYDMHGNVWEWTYDWHDWDYYKESAASQDPVGAASGWGRVVRGGSWRNEAESCRSAFRGAGGSLERNNAFGFRLVLVVDDQVQRSQTQTELSSVQLQDSTGTLDDSDVYYYASDGPESIREASTLKMLSIAGVEVNFRWAPAGSFLMGSPNDEEWRKPDEAQHRVKLTQGFWGAETLTTEELWHAVMVKNDVEVNKLLPAAGSWYDWKAFVDKLNLTYASALPSGFQYAMPTEAQWEYACRAGTTTEYNNGDDCLSADDANFLDTSSVEEPDRKPPVNTDPESSPVRSYSPNVWGLYDMHGNMYEWTCDWYAEDYFQLPISSSALDPTGPINGTNRVLRGGCYGSQPDECRSASRYHMAPESSGHGTCGFRLVLVRSERSQPEVVSIDKERDDAEEMQEGTRESGALMSLEILGVKVNFRWAPSGSFLMGSPDDEQGRQSDEAQHRVTLTQGFGIAETLTTQELWESLMAEENPSCHRGSSLLPVDRVTWNDCREFVNELNCSCRDALPSGYKYALPTEAQWEYACRAGVTTAFNFGDSLNGDLANCNGTEPYGTSARGRRLERTTPGKFYPPNAWGLFDMHGNLFEWCADWYGEDYYASDATGTDPTGPLCGANRVLRGGSWDSAAQQCRAACRSELDPGKGNAYTGFRLVIVKDVQNQQTPKEQLLAEQPNARPHVVTTEREYPDGNVAEAQRAPGALITLLIAGAKVNFHWAPAGTFTMGSPEDERGHWKWPCEEFLHEVTLTRGFWAAETETTQELWQAVMGNNPSLYKDSNQLPVENISWNDYRDFVETLNCNFSAALPSGYQYAMPTEAQWEYACRAGTTTPFNFGDCLNGDKANCRGDYHPYGTRTKGEFKDRTTPVKSYAPNAWGLYDMHGNVEEWVADWFDSDYYKSSAVMRDPTGPVDGTSRVLRGGNFNDSAMNCRSACRMLAVPNSQFYTHGFRLVLVQRP